MSNQPASDPASVANTATTATQASENTQTLGFKLRYQQPSDFHQDHVQLFSQLDRENVQFQGTVKDPLLFREAMATLFAIVSSDYRYVPKDRTAYTAFMRMRRRHEHQGLMQAQCAYFDWLLRNDPLAWLILDPVISVYPDQLVLEVFSKDEGSYAMLTFEHACFTVEGDVKYGTTHIDYSEALSQGIEQIRSNRATQLSIGQQAVHFKTETAAALPDTEVLEKAIQVPTSWLRGFLQVQSAAQLSSATFQLKPLDVYNALHHLRMHADTKGKRRGLCIELVPGEKPLLVLEPDNTLIQTSAGIYKGKQAQVIRLWGRRRLMLLKRFLPYADSIHVTLLGNGMPSYWVLKGQGVSLTLAITGFTAANWSQALSFDLLMPRRAQTATELEAVVQHLKSVHQATLTAIGKALSLSKKACSAALQQACQQGFIMFDVATGCYRYRPLSAQPLDESLFQFRLPAEKLAYDLIERQQAISPLTTRIIHGEGVEISAEIQVKEDRRSYLVKLKLNEEGHVAKAECSCHQIMQNGLSQGPCSHLIALRLAYAHQQNNRQVAGITQETRAYSRRRKQQEQHYRLTLDNKQLLIEWHIQQKPRQQQFAFNSDAEARQAYLSKIQQLENSGFIDTTTA